MRGRVGATRVALTVCLLLAAPSVGRASPVEDAQAAVARDPNDGRAQWTLGLALARAGRHTEALAAFDAAAKGSAAPEPGLLAFNRGAVLSGLGRQSEAEQAFLLAAFLDKKLAAVATYDAALAAEDAGALERARLTAKRVAALPGGDKLAPEVADLLADLDDAEREQRATEAQRRTDERRRIRAEGRDALAAGDTALAAIRYGDALVAARRDAAPPSEQAELLYGLGRAFYKAGDCAKAGLAFAQAATLAPTEADFALMQGVAAVECDHPRSARAALHEALRRGLDAETAAAAVARLDALDGGLRALGRGLEVHAAAAAGYDTNPNQSGPRADATNLVDTPTGRSTELTLNVDVALRGGVGDWGFAELRFESNQVVYPDVAADSFDVLRLAGAFEARLGRAVRLGVGLEGERTFTGISSFEAFEDDLTPSANLVVAEHERTATHLDFEYGWSNALDPAFAYFDGTHTEVGLSQELRFRRFRAQLAARRHDENRGVQLSAPSRLFAFRGCKLVTCEGTYIIPYAYRGKILDLAATLTLHRRVQLVGELNLERRDYPDKSYLLVSTALDKMMASCPLRCTDVKNRIDGRVTLDLALIVGLPGPFEGALRLDYLRSTSNVDNTLGGAHTYDYDNRNFTRKTALAERRALVKSAIDRA